MKFLFTDFPWVIFNISPQMPNSHSKSHSLRWFSPPCLCPLPWIRLETVPTLFFNSPMHPTSCCGSWFAGDQLWKRCHVLVLHRFHTALSDMQSLLWFGFTMFFQPACVSRITSIPTSFRKFSQILPGRIYFFLCHMFPCAFMHL